VQVELVISTGISDDDLVDAALRSAAGAPEVALLYCVSAYPTPPGSAALAGIPALALRCGVTIGYSDHTLGLEACLEPDELRTLVARVRDVEALMGRRRTGVLPEEAARVTVSS